MDETGMARGGAPRKLTAQALEEAALRYLERYASSSANLRRILLAKVRRAAEKGRVDRAAGVRMIEDLIARYLAVGLLDDRAYAAQKAASLFRRGASRHGMRGRLAQKGVDDEIVDAALSALDEAGDAEIAAACALVRRRRLGPYRPPGTRAAARRRDLGVLARAGFSLQVARRVLAARDPEALEALSRSDED